MANDVTFPKGDPKDFFLVSTSAGPAYLLRREDLEAASKKYVQQLKDAIQAYKEDNIVGLDIDTVSAISEGNIIQPHNRRPRPPK